MAFVKKRNQELPEDAVIISEDEAYSYELQIIKNWEKFSEVWALRWGPGILGFIGGVSGAYINNHFRKKLKLGNYGKLSTYLPIVVLPAMLTTLNHKFMIQKPILLQSIRCPVCIEIRAVTYQFGFSIAYPLIIAPFAVLMFATRHYTYRLPSITTEPKEVFKLMLKFTKPLGGFVIGSLILNIMGATTITYNEMKQFYSIKEKLFETANSEEISENQIFK